jgi:hypothetical protein
MLNAELIPESECLYIIKREYRGQLTARLSIDIKLEYAISHDLVSIETLRVTKGSISRSYSKIIKSLSR